MQRNVDNQKWIVFAFNETDNTPVTGDAANITANIRLDGGGANGVDDTNPTELEDGYYVFDITQAECNADLLSLHPESATSDIQVIGVPGSIYTRPANFPALGIESDGDLTKTNTCDTNTDMRGTDNGALASVTALEATSLSISGDISDLDVKIDVVQTDLDNTDQFKADVSALALEATSLSISGDIINISVDVTSIKSIVEALDLSVVMCRLSKP